jgi:cytochrome c biogenesis protein CcmG, thiol:disulfide interchange protein DsbE
MLSDAPPQSSHHSRRSVLKGSAALGLLGGLPLLNPLAHANALRVGEPAPLATLTTLDGQRISTSALPGQVVILTFWATWCVPCREELPVLSEYAAEHADRGLSVLGFSLDSADKMSEVMQVARQLRFPVGLLANSSAPGYGRIWRIPVNFTIDRQGRLVNNGWREKQPTWTRQRLVRVVTPLLEASR